MSALEEELAEWASEYQEASERVKSLIATLVESKSKLTVSQSMEDFEKENIKFLSHLQQVFKEQMASYWKEVGLNLSAVACVHKLSCMANKQVEKNLLALSIAVTEKIMWTFWIGEMGQLVVVRTACLHQCQ